LQQRGNGSRSSRRGRIGDGVNLVRFAMPASHLEIWEMYQQEQHEGCSSFRVSGRRLFLAG